MPTFARLFPELPLTGVFVTVPAPPQNVSSLATFRRLLELAEGMVVDGRRGDDFLIVVGALSDLAIDTVSEALGREVALRTRFDAIWAVTDSALEGACCCGDPECNTPCACCA